MNVKKIIEIDYDSITDYDNMTLSNCTKNEYDIDIIIPTFILTISWVLSLLCSMSLMVYTLIKPSIIKWWKNFYNRIIQLGVL